MLWVIPLMSAYACTIAPWSAQLHTFSNVGCVLSSSRQVFICQVCVTLTCITRVDAGMLSGTAKTSDSSHVTLPHYHTEAQK